MSAVAFGGPQRSSERRRGLRGSMILDPLQKEISERQREKVGGGREMKAVRRSLNDRRTAKIGLVDAMGSKQGSPTHVCCIFFNAMHIEAGPLMACPPPSPPFLSPLFLSLSLSHLSSNSDCVHEGKPRTW